MERTDYRLGIEHVVNVTSNCDASSSLSNERRPPYGSEHKRSDYPSTSSTAPMHQSHSFPTGESQARNSSTTRRGGNRTRQRSPLNSGLWISVELILTVGQIIAAIVVLSLSKHEKPRAPLKTWILGYVSGCFLLLPVLYWRFVNRIRASEQNSSQHQGSFQANNSTVPLSRGSTDGPDNWTSEAASRTTQSIGFSNSRLKVYIEYLKIGLDCFFAVWFVFGFLWIFGGHSLSSEAPSIYRLCIVFLTITCIGYAMPFILCAAICCCFPCFLSLLEFREDFSQTRGATQDSINSLPICTFKLKKNTSRNDKECSSSASEGGIVAAGTEKERALSGEDAICCICLAKYVNNNELRELPCSHFFHKHCVDKWLRINASCPLCKSEVGETIFSSLRDATASLRNF